MRIHLDEQCVINASESFWLQMLAMTLDPIKSPAEPFLAAGHIQAGVGLSGAWLGRIEVRMAERLAYEATASMMMQAVETVKQEDALDAAREIANMIAGVIKPSLPRPCDMTIPQSAIAPEGFCGEMRFEQAVAVWFRHVSGDLLVQVWENEYVPEP
jgi:CheY-specific phosphatase CheX